MDAAFEVVFCFGILLVVLGGGEPLNAPQSHLYRAQRRGDDGVISHLFVELRGAVAIEFA